MRNARVAVVLMALTVACSADPQLGAASTSTTTSTSTASTSTTSTSTTVAPTLDDCQQVATAVAHAHAGASQVVVVIAPAAPASAGTLQIAELGVSGWQCTAVMTARLGKKGVRPLTERRSGDGTTPAGVFPLGTMTAWDGQVFSFFGNSADPGVSAGAYRRVRTGDCFGATPNDPDYGHLVQRSAAQCPGPDDEYLPAVRGAYEHAALIGANMEPVVSGDEVGETPYAAAIFLHRFSYDATGSTRPTAGCVSLAHDDLLAVLRALRPGVLFAIGTKDWLLANV
ncbi:MAG: hypothetical protein F2681_07520 [Actinobacteria bacterium]|nr:hypothetical protein [Actinomycetota bacterium]MSW77157.1 hypothetical protein [Actinomycetota bacterium]MSZ82975.1 hypothetical protein [Actinomycetota bacterium]MTB17443.1 hypothetical protein [Actinomycetota bacterium]